MRPDQATETVKSILGIGEPHKFKIGGIPAGGVDRGGAYRNIGRRRCGDGSAPLEAAGRMAVSSAGVRQKGGADWGGTYSFSGVALTPGTTYYLQIDGRNGGGSGSIIGGFTLSDSSFQSANGSQSLVTDTSDWTYSYTGFGANAFTPTD